MQSLNKQHIHDSREAPAPGIEITVPGAPVAGPCCYTQCTRGPRCRLTLTTRAHAFLRRPQQDISLSYLWVTRFCLIAVAIALDSFTDPGKQWRVGGVLHFRIIMAVVVVLYLIAKSNARVAQ